MFIFNNKVPLITHILMSNTIVCKRLVVVFAVWIFTFQNILSKTWLFYPKYKYSILSAIFSFTLKVTLYKMPFINQVQISQICKLKYKTLLIFFLIGFPPNINIFAI